MTARQGAPPAPGAGPTREPPPHPPRGRAPAQETPFSGERAAGLGVGSLLDPRGGRGLPGPPVRSGSGSACARGGRAGAGLAPPTCKGSHPLRAGNVAAEALCTEHRVHAARRYPRAERGATGGDKAEVPPPPRRGGWSGSAGSGTSNFHTTALPLPAPGSAAELRGSPLSRPYPALPRSAKRWHVCRTSVYVYSAGTGGTFTTKQS